SLACRCEQLLGDLAACPPRRSSDLPGWRATMARRVSTVQRVPARVSKSETIIAGPTVAAAARAEAAAAAEEIVDLDRQLRELRRDRKSTRLNSSHADISDAVLRLKK